MKPKDTKIDQNVSVRLRSASSDEFIRVSETLKTKQLLEWSAPKCLVFTNKEEDLSKVSPFLIKKAV